MMMWKMLNMWCAEKDDALDDGDVGDDEMYVGLGRVVVVLAMVVSLF